MPHATSPSPAGHHQTGVMGGALHGGRIAGGGRQGQQVKGPRRTPTQLAGLASTADAPWWRSCRKGGGIHRLRSGCTRGCGARPRQAGRFCRVWADFCSLTDSLLSASACSETFVQYRPPKPLSGPSQLFCAPTRLNSAEVKPTSRRTPGPDRRGFRTAPAYTSSLRFHGRDAARRCSPPRSGSSKSGSPPAQRPPICRPCASRWMRCRGHPHTKRRSAGDGGRPSPPRRASGCGRRPGRALREGARNRAVWPPGKRCLNGGEGWNSGGPRSRQAPRSG